MWAKVSKIKKTRFKLEPSPDFSLVFFLCSVENLCEHAGPTLNHGAEYSHRAGKQPRLRGFVSLSPRI
jgi:hypothetical protein